MPIASRKQLRHRLGLDYLNDLVVGTTALSLGANANIIVMDRTYADAGASGDTSFQRAHLRVASADYRVGSFNFPSGAWVTQTPGIAAVSSGADFEIGTLLSHRDRDRRIDEAIRKTLIQRDVSLLTELGRLQYTMDGAASPHEIVDIVNVRVEADPSNSVNRDFRYIPSSQWHFGRTATGRELRLSDSLAGSESLVVEALLQLTLGAGDAATFDFPERYDEVILKGAEAMCWVQLSKPPTPAAERALNRTQAQIATADYKRLRDRLLRRPNRPIQLQTPV